MAKQTLVGLMSGTSLDGLDMAVCEFWDEGEKLKWQILNAETRPYSSEWAEKLKNAHLLSGQDLLKLHHAYGEYLGETVLGFLDQKNIDHAKIDAICSHGHTIFHQPEGQFTFQLGHGGNIAAKTGKRVIADFRLQDMILGGQGAPLVPIGDRLLFRAYDFCLNIGGIANISLETESGRLAWDICPANMVLNRLSQKLGKQFDNDGAIAARGLINTQLLDKLNNLPYYHEKPPKTLGREWVETEVFKLIDNVDLSITDLLTTYTEHIAFQVGEATHSFNGNNILITGGGAMNDYLVSRINKFTGLSVILPEAQVINFKEALIFALLGFLKIQNRVNVLQSVTGAEKDHITGIEFKT